MKFLTNFNFKVIFRISESWAFIWDHFSHKIQKSEMTHSDWPKIFRLFTTFFFKTDSIKFSDDSKIMKTSLDRSISRCFFFWKWVSSDELLVSLSSVWETLFRRLGRSRRLCFLESFKLWRRWAADFENNEAGRFTTRTTSSSCTPYLNLWN